MFAALCCASLPVVGAPAAIGLSFLRTDVILLPLLAVSVAVALWGRASGARRSRAGCGPHLALQRNL